MASRTGACPILGTVDRGDIIGFRLQNGLSDACRDIDAVGRQPWGIPLVDPAAKARSTA
jgi:hypothetical protein